MATVGEIRECSRSFEWRIPDFFSLPEKYNRYSSPDFECGDGTCYVAMYPNSLAFPGCMSLHLYGRSSDLSKYVGTTTYNIKVKYGKDYIQSDTVDITTRGVFSGGKILERSKLLEAKDQLAQKGALTVFCTVNLHRSVAKGAQLTNEERSIEECTTGEENSKKEDEELDEKDIFRIPRGVNKTIHDLKSLLLNERDCDITLKLPDREFRAHKLILGARSPVFCSMFQHNTLEKSSGVVDISDCNPDSFKDFLVYMYSGRVEKMDSSNVLSLYSVADKYNVDDLKKDCLELMEKELSVDTFGDVIALAVLHSESALIESATAFFTKNVKKIIVTAKWQSFLNQNPTAANELHIKALDVLIQE